MNTVLDGAVVKWEVLRSDFITGTLADLAEVEVFHKSVPVKYFVRGF
jgi:hypothetical protein